MVNKSKRGLQIGRELERSVVARSLASLEKRCREVAIGLMQH